jgi:hypothetical protein
MFNFFKSRTGQETFSFSNILIHSSFNPLKEAEKYVNTLFSDLKIYPNTIILITPGLNYLYDVLKKKYPYSKYIIFHADKKIYNHTENKYSTQDCVWYDGSPEELNTFLRKRLREIDLKGLQVITWKPSVKAFLSLSETIETKITDIIREYNGNINTTNYFGKRYFKNITKNLISLSATLLLNRVNKPVFISSSGPSLEKSLTLLKKQRDNIFLLALSSSVRFLLDNGVIPDLILTTDPGFYSTYHLKKSVSSNIPIASPLTAYHHQSFKNPLLLLNQNTIPEKYFFPDFIKNSFYVPQNGTVSGTALHLASSLTEYPIFFSGLDFCTDDIKAHCLPNEFDITGDLISERLSPSLNRMYSNTVPSYSYKTGSKGNRTTIQLKTYSSWFNNIEGNREIFRINKSDIPIQSFTDISEKDADKIISSLSSSGIKKSSVRSSMKIQSVDRELIHSSAQKSLKTIKESLHEKRKSGLENTYFDNYLEDILYYYSASGYLDVFDLFSSGEKIKSHIKFNSLIDESISFFENLGRCMESYE